MDAAKSDEGSSLPLVRGFSLGPFETNCYIVTPSRATPGNDGWTPCWVVDPGFEPREVVDLLQAERLRPEKVILTHAHLDHVAGVADVVRAFPGTPVLIHEAERDWPENPDLNLSAGYGFPVRAPAPTGVFRDGDVLTLGADDWTVLHTPGHSPGGITLHHGPSRQAIVGDSLFAGSIGRTDFPGADFETLARSIRMRLYTMPPETAVYPGHGPVTSIGREKLTNPFVRP